MTHHDILAEDIIPIIDQYINDFIDEQTETLNKYIEMYEHALYRMFKALPKRDDDPFEFVLEAFEAFEELADKDDKMSIYATIWRFKDND